MSHVSTWTNLTNIILSKKATRGRMYQCDPLYLWFKPMGNVLKNRNETHNILTEAAPGSKRGGIGVSLVVIMHFFISVGT